jgi:CHAD domain-containing protein
MRRRAAADSSGAMEKFVREQTTARLNRFAFELHRAARMRDAQAIHDLRVSIRRLSQCLRIFRQFFPNKEVKRIHRRLRAVMDLAAVVRNRDIARELLERAGGGPPLRARLIEQRKHAERDMVDEIVRISRRELSARWRARLGL